MRCNTFPVQAREPPSARSRHAKHSHTMCRNGCCVQGTAATACAGVYGALAVQGKSIGAIADQRFVIVGAGSAGMGVTTMLSLCLVKHVRPSCI